MIIKKIWIDVGHGGYSPGAVRGKVLEKELNLTVALKLQKVLFDAGYIVGISRATDVFQSESQRIKLLKTFNPDLIISIHHNAGGGHGFALYHSIKGGIGQEVSEVIAKHFKAAGQEPEGITGILQRGNSKGIADYYFIHRQGIPEKTILSEYAFMDSADYEIIDTKPELEKEAEAIFNAIQEFNGVTPNNPIAALQKALQRAGFNWLIVTGVMDAGTREAIKQFKVKYNIVDSIGSTALTKEAQDKLREFYL